MKLYKNLQNIIKSVDMVEQRRVGKQIKGKEIETKANDKGCTLAAGILKIVIFGLIMSVAGLIIANVIQGYDPIVTVCSLGVVPVAQCIIAGLMILGALMYLIYGLITISFAKKGVERYYMKRMQILSMNLLDMFAMVVCGVLMAIIRQGEVFIIAGVIMGVALICCILKFVDYCKQVKKYNEKMKENLKE